MSVSVVTTAHCDKCGETRTTEYSSSLITDWVNQHRYRSCVDVAMRESDKRAVKITKPEKPRAIMKYKLQMEDFGL